MAAAAADYPENNGDIWNDEAPRSKVLITGGAGYIGSTLVPMLINEGYSVIIYDMFRWGIGPFLNPYLKTTHLEIINGDILDEVTVQSLIKRCDAIIHLAGIVSAPAFNRYPEIAQEINERGTEILAESITQDQCLIYASVETVYGNEATRSLIPCTEDTLRSPISLFAKTKMNDENIVLKSNGVVLRIPSAFGISPRLRLDLLINNLVYEACTKSHIDLYQGDCKRNFIHVQDVARGFVFSLKNADKMRGKAFNVGHDSLVYTKRQICDVITKHLPDITINEPKNDGYQDADKRDFQMSFDRLLSLGFRVTKTVSDGVVELLKVLPFLTKEEVERCQAL